MWQAYVLWYKAHLPSCCLSSLSAHQCRHERTKNDTSIHLRALSIENLLVFVSLVGLDYLNVVCHAGLQAALRFSPAAFFYGLLPPIVFAAGFTLKKRDFFRNFGTISVFAVPGTFISALFFGLITYALVAIKVVKRSHLGTAPLIECLLYGEPYFNARVLSKTCNHLHSITLPCAVQCSAAHTLMGLEPVILMHHLH